MGNWARDAAELDRRLGRTPPTVEQPAAEPPKGGDGSLDIILNDGRRLPEGSPLLIVGGGGGGSSGNAACGEYICGGTAYDSEGPVARPRLTAETSRYVPHFENLYGLSRRRPGERDPGSTLPPMPVAIPVPMRTYGVPAAEALWPPRYSESPMPFTKVADWWLQRLRERVVAKILAESPADAARAGGVVPGVNPGSGRVPMRVFILDSISPEEGGVGGEAIVDVPQTITDHIAAICADLRAKLAAPPGATSDAPVGEPLRSTVYRRWWTINEMRAKHTALMMRNTPPPDERTDRDAIGRGIYTWIGRAVDPLASHPRTVVASGVVARVTHDTAPEPTGGQ